MKCQCPRPYCYYKNNDMSCNYPREGKARKKQKTPSEVDGLSILLLIEQKDGTVTEVKNVEWVNVAKENK
jgi:hypothetical protein